LHSKVTVEEPVGKYLSVNPLFALAVEGTDDMKRLLARLEKQSSPAHDQSYTSFSH